jgi:hypothetical protein
MKINKSKYLKRKAFSGAVLDSTNYAGSSIGNSTSSNLSSIPGGGIGGFSNLAGSAIDLAQASRNSNKPSAGLSAASGALKGISAGAALGPIGMGVGAVVGGTIGFINAKKEQREIDKANKIAYDSKIQAQSLANQNAMNRKAMDIAGNYEGYPTNNVFKNGGEKPKEKTRPINILTKPIKSSIPQSPKPTLAKAFKNGGPVGILDVLNNHVRYEDGGKMIPVANGVQEVIGDNPNKVDDVSFGNNTLVSHGEAIVPKGDSDLVVSNNPELPNLIKPKETYAESYLKNTKKLKAQEGRTSTASKGSIIALNMRNQRLEKMQQIMNGNSQGELA